MSEVRNRRDGFLWISNALFDQFVSKLKPSTLIVYFVLARMADNETQSCFPSYEKISAVTGLSRGTVADCLRELKACGIIEWTKQARHNLYTLLDSRSINFRLLEQPGVQIEASKSPKKLLEASSPSDTNKTYNKTQEQERTSCSPENQSSSEEFVLSQESPKKKPKSVDPRHALFKEKLVKCWSHINGSKELYWDASEAAQLSMFLKKWPDLTLDQFRDALWNYVESEEIIKSQTPRQFLGKLNLFFDSPLNKYGKPVDAAKAAVH